MQKLYLALRSDVSQESLSLAGIWVIGEYSDILLTSSPAGMGDENAGEEADHQSNGIMKVVQPVDIIDLFENVLNSPYFNTLIRQYLLVASSKLSTRLDELTASGTYGGHTAEVKQRVAKLLKKFENSVELEIQQRSVEFGVLLEKLDDNIKIGVLERMPPPELKATVMGTGEMRVGGFFRLRCHWMVTLTGPLPFIQSLRSGL